MVFFADVIAIGPRTCYSLNDFIAHLLDLRILLIILVYAFLWIFTGEMKTRTASHRRHPLHSDEATQSITQKNSRRILGRQTTRKKSHQRKSGNPSPNRKYRLQKNGTPTHRTWNRQKMEQRGEVPPSQTNWMGAKQNKTTVVLLYSLEQGKCVVSQPSFVGTHPNARPPEKERT